MTDWAPACMDADELAAWAAMRDRSTAQADHRAIPCTDCLLPFAIEMRAVGRCNGTPHGVEEDEDMDQTEPIAARPQASTPPRRMALDVTAPPCDSCVHESVCALRAAFEGMATVEIGALSVPAGLRLAVMATVECEHFLRDRSKPAPVRVLTSQERGQANGAAKYWTPERRAAQGERMRARNAAKAEGAAVAS